MQTIRIIISLSFVALAVYYAWITYNGYKKATGTIWQRLLSSAESSATILWSRFCFVLSGIVANLDSLAEMAGLPQVETFINTWIPNPKIIAAIMLGLSFVTVFARKRTL